MRDDTTSAAMPLAELGVAPIGGWQRTTAGEHVARQVIALIEEMGLRPGDEVPAEAELARRFQVNRLAVREAIRILTAREILISSQGRPARVTVPGHRVFAQMLEFRLRQQSLRFGDLAEARRALEGAVARKAAQRAGQGSVSTHRAELLLADMAATVSDPDRFIALDFEFHRELANLADNDTLQLLLDSLAGVLLEARRSSYVGRLLRGGGHADTIADHRAVLHAIRAGDPELAASAMDRHLLDTVEDLRAAEVDDE